MKKILICIFAFSLFIRISAQTAPFPEVDELFQKGEEFFQMNKPEAAAECFEKILDDPKANPLTFVYLGISYYQMKEYAKSLSVCVKGLAKENTDHKVLAFNAGNSCYALGNYVRADACFSIAVKDNPDFAPAVLNKANSQLKLDHLEEAKTNYEKYLELEPENPQHEKITLLISLLDAEIQLRANQKPELINPDDFVESEENEIPEIPERIAAEVPPEDTVESDEVVMEKIVFDDLDIPEDIEELEESKAADTEIVDDIKVPELPRTEIIVIKTSESKLLEDILPPELTDMLEGEKPSVADHEEKSSEIVKPEPVPAVSDFVSEKKEAEERIIAEKIKMESIPSAHIVEKDASSAVPEPVKSEKVKAEVVPALPVRKAPKPPVEIELPPELNIREAR